MTLTEWRSEVSASHLPIPRKVFDSSNIAKFVSLGCSTGGIAIACPFLNFATLPFFKVIVGRCCMSTSCGNRCVVGGDFSSSFILFAFCSVNVPIEVRRRFFKYAAVCRVDPISRASARMYVPAETDTSKVNSGYVYLISLMLWMVIGRGSTFISWPARAYS